MANAYHAPRRLASCVGLWTPPSGSDSQTGLDHLCLRPLLRMRRFKLTVYFVITALLVMSLVTLALSFVSGRLAEENLVRVTEENTARDAQHIESMMTLQAASRSSSVAAPMKHDVMKDNQMEHHQRHVSMTRGYVNRCVNDIRRRPSQPLSQRRSHPRIERRDRRLRSTQGPSDA